MESPGRKSSFVIGMFTQLVLSSCAPVGGPDKTIAGAILGAGWGAGAGAVIGNQLDASGPGAAIGAGFGAGSGFLTGIGYDLGEGTELVRERELDALRMQLASNEQALLSLQSTLDDRDSRLRRSSVTTQIFFDPDLAAIRLGSARTLQELADTIKRNPYVGRVEVHGHSDDTGDPERNQSLSEARARTVATFLASQGISLDQISTIAHGASQPIATNRTEAGRQMNRRVEIVLKK